MGTKLGVLAGGLGLFCVAMPALAHHGFALEYDANKKVSLTGVVTKVEWTNPHMHVYVDVRDADGKVTAWNLEMTSPNIVRRQGWGRNALTPGDEVNFDAFGGLVVETTAFLSRIAKVDTPDEPLFVQGGPEAAVP